MVWSILEALALIAICIGGYLLAGPLALIAWGVLVIVLSLIFNRKGGSA